MIWILIILVLIILYLSARYLFSLAIDRYGKNFFNINQEERVENEDRLFSNRYDELEWIIESYDGLKLKANFIKNEGESKGVVIVCHGYIGSNRDMVSFANMFYDLGFDVLLPDARGHGRSEGSYYGFGWHERHDQIKWINRIIEEFGEDINIILYGASMGAATVMCTSGEDLPENVKLIIQDCGYTSVWDELKYQMKALFKLPAFPIAHATSLYTKIRVGFSFKEASPIKQIKKNRLPILMIHGDADTFVPYEMLDELYEAAHDPKEKYIVPGAGHGAALKTDPDKYKEVVKSFIQKYM